jgi:serine/threonine-protein kinase
MSRVVIEVIAGPQRGEVLEFDRAETLLVGRSSKAGLRLAGDPYFSRQHFRLEIDPPACLFVDLGSVNGTSVNEQRVPSAQLRDGDVISGGDTMIRVRIINADVEPPDAASSLNCRPPNAGWADKTVIESTPAAAAASTDGVQGVPGYVFKEILGRGAMGVVYRAVHQATMREVAVKVIIPENQTTPESLQLFAREASILSQLRHPGIVRFHEFGLVAGQLFLAMEYVRALSIQELVKEETPPQRTRVFCRIACEVLGALVYAHAKSLVHRDIKPANILVAKTDGKLALKLADFGLAKNYASAGFSGMTHEGQRRGTIAFMPPEQVVDSRYAKPPADIYAVGATLYHYLTGAYPFEMSTAQEAMRTVLEGKLIPLQQRRPDLPDELAGVVHRALAKEPAARFPNAKSMGKALLPFTR